MNMSCQNDNRSRREDVFKPFMAFITGVKEEAQDVITMATYLHTNKKQKLKNQRQKNDRRLLLMMFIFC